MNSIKATVLQKNNEAFVCNPCGGYGKTMPIPANGGGTVICSDDYWAQPVKSNGFFQGFQWKEKTDTAPSVDSIACCRVINTVTNDTFMVACTVAEYTAAAAACCDASPVPTLVSTLGPIAPCQNTCNDGDGNYKAYFAVTPAVDIASPVNGKYVATVVVDNVTIAQQTFGTGSTSIAALITWLNTNASSVGTWSNVTDTETIILTSSVQQEVCFVACVKTS